MTANTSDEVMNYPAPRDTKCPFDPPPALTEVLQTEGAARVRIWDGSEPWLITRYNDVKSLFADEAKVSADPRRSGYPEQNAGFKATVGSDQSLRTLDNPEHDIQKRMIMGSLSVKAVEAMRPTIQATVDGLIDDMLAQGTSADLMADFATPIPTMVLCELMGVPYEDRDFIAASVETSFSHHTPLEEAQAVGDAFFAYLDELIDKRLAEPDDALVSRLIQEQMLTGNLSRQAVKEIARAMVFAGTETTAAAIALGVLTLMQHPDQLAEIAATDDRKVVTNAINELMRYLSVTHTGRRRAVIAPVDICGRRIQPGEGVIVSNSLADRDETVFPDASVFDIHRPNARQTMAFGYGVHQCPGQFLSRVEQQIVLSTILKRIPTLRLAVPFEEVRFKESGTVYSLEALPVEWDPI